MRIVDDFDTGCGVRKNWSFLPISSCATTRGAHIINHERSIAGILKREMVGNFRIVLYFPKFVGFGAQPLHFARRAK